MRALALTLFAAAWAAGASADHEPHCILPPEASQPGPSRDDVVGHYESVSESEWNLELWLRPDGAAEVLSEVWDAGHYDQRTTVRYRGSWSLSGSFVQLRYRGLCETLRFDPALSFAEFGTAGAAPGLEGKHSSVSSNPFIARSLWRADRLPARSKVGR